MPGSGRVGALASVLCFVLAGSSCSDDGPAPSAVTTTTPPFAAIERTGPDVSTRSSGGLLLVARAQSTPGNRLLIDRASLGDEAGFIAIYIDNQGAPGGLLGASELLERGESRHIDIRLDRHLADRTPVWAMIHRDDNANGTFDYPDGDRPPDDGGGTTAVRFDVTITDG